MRCGAQPHRCPGALSSGKGETVAQPNLISPLTSGGTSDKSHKAPSPVRACLTTRFLEERDVHIGCGKLLGENTHPTGLHPKSGLLALCTFHLIQKREDIESEDAQV